MTDLSERSADVEKELKLVLADTTVRDRLLLALRVSSENSESENLESENFAKVKSIRQENYFFDTPERLASGAGWALRVRIETNASGGKSATLTAKGPNLRANRSDNIVERVELEESLDMELANSVVAGALDIRSLDSAPLRLLKEYVANQPLSPLVSFANERVKVLFPVGQVKATLDIDTTTFSNGDVDCELELELEDDQELKIVEEKLKELFSSLGLEYKVQKKSKLQRANEKGPQV